MTWFLDKSQTPESPLSRPTKPGSSPMLPKLARRAREIRSIILAEAVRQPVCPPDIDVAVRPDADHGWRADIVSPDQIDYTGCALYIGRTVERLRRQYDLKDS
jgi:hypothetical protein